MQYVGNQESKMIRQWLINFYTSPIMINKITSSVSQIRWLKRLHTQLNKPTNHSNEKSPKFLSQQIRKRNYKTLGTIVINSPLSPLYLKWNTLLSKVCRVFVTLLYNSIIEQFGRVYNPGYETPLTPDCYFSFWRLCVATL